jgi:hypothetical protein
MKIQAAGRLGNNLFIWAYALGISKETGKTISIFSDKFHTNLGQDEEETIRLLGSKSVRFVRSNNLGAALKSVDWLRQYSKQIYRLATFVMRIGTEGEGNTQRRYILRGYFQNSEYVVANAQEIASTLIRVVKEIANDSQLITEINNHYEKYQVIHLRLGDFVDTRNGTVNSSTYYKLLDRELPVIVCTDGEKSDVERLLDFKVDLVLTPNESTSWETLAIFSNASTFIGVNSTLSWWGAFIASRKGSSAFLPEYWSTSSTANAGNLLRIHGVTLYKNDFL